MTPAELRAEVRSLLGKKSTDSSLTDDYINRLAHRAMVKMFRAGRPLESRAQNTQNLVAAQANYYLPADCIEVLAVQLYNGAEYTRIPRTTQESLDIQNGAGWETDTMLGQVYFNAGVETTAGSDYGKLIITLAPAPVASVTNGLKVRYARRPLKFSELDDPDDSEIVDIPEDYQDCLVHYVAYYHLLGQRERAKDAQVYLALWKESLKDYCEELQELWQPDLELSMQSGREGLREYWESY